VLCMARSAYGIFLWPPCQKAEKVEGFRNSATTKETTTSFSNVTAEKASAEAEGIEARSCRALCMGPSKCALVVREHSTLKIIQTRSQPLDKFLRGLSIILTLTAHVLLCASELLTLCTFHDL
jgi:hypothetical protein